MIRIICLNLLFGQSDCQTLTAVWRSLNLWILDHHGALHFELIWENKPAITVILNGYNTLFDTYLAAL